MDCLEIEGFLKNQLDFFMRRLVVLEDGLVPSSYDISSKQPASRQNMVNDLGDYIQYLYAADQLTGETCNAQIMDLLECAFCPQSYRDYLSAPKRGFKATIDTGDFLVGLNSMLYSSIDQNIKDKILGAVDRYIDEFYGDINKLHSLSYKGMSIPLVYWYSLYNDVEELVYIYEYTGEARYLEVAKILYEFSGKYKKMGCPTIASFRPLWLNRLAWLFPLNIYTTILSKTMSNYCVASLKIAPYVDGIDLELDVVKPIIENFYDASRKRFSTVSRRFEPSAYNLAQNHPALSVFVDSDADLGFDYMAVVDDIIEENYDYPYHYFGTESFHLDGIVDFATLLLKLYDKTKKGYLLDVAERYLIYIDRHFRSSFGFYVQGNSKMVETVYSTKFQSLVMKPYILLHKIKRGEGIYNDRFAYLLSRDR